MSAYLAVVSARYRLLLQYRTAAFAGFVTQFFWGAIRIMILGAFFATTMDEQPMSFAQVVSYVWLGQAFLGILPWNVDEELARMIREGGVSYELMRPLDLYTFWFARTVALRTATTTLRSVPMVLVALIVLPIVGLSEYALAPPPDPVSFTLFVVSLAASVMLASAITMVMHVMLVWTLSGEGFNRIMPGLTNVLSGMVIPLPLFPDWAQPLLEWQPFRGLVDVPFRIYSGNIPATEAIWDILHQLVWTGVIVAFGRWLLQRSLRDLVVQGG